MAKEVLIIFFIYCSCLLTGLIHLLMHVRVHYSYSSIKSKTTHLPLHCKTFSCKYMLFYSFVFWYRTLKSYNLYKIMVNSTQLPAWSHPNPKANLFLLIKNHQLWWFLWRTSKWRIILEKSMAKIILVGREIKGVSNKRWGHDSKLFTFRSWF